MLIIIINTTPCSCISNLLKPFNYLKEESLFKDIPGNVLQQINKSVNFFDALNVFCVT